MEGRPQLTEEEAWKKLKAYYDQEGTKLNILQEFKRDPGRFDKYRYVALELTAVDLHLTLRVLTQNVILCC